MTSPAIRLDVRPLPTWERHPRVRSAFDQLDDGATLIVVTDHEPRPLRTEFEAVLSHRFVWLQRRVGEHCWEAHIRAVQPSSGREPRVTVLRKCALFVDMSPETEAMLGPLLAERHLASGEALFEQDADWPHLGVVLDGSLDVIKSSPKGREQILFEVLPFDTVGEAGAFDGGRTMGRAIAMSSSATVLLIPRLGLLAAVASDGAVARAATSIVAQRTRTVVDRLAANVARTTIERVAEAILPYASPEPGLAPASPKLALMTQAHLAIIAGTVKEVVARAIADLEAAGALAREGGRIARVDRAKLVALLEERL